MIKRFESIDVRKAMEQVKEELGSDALIFSTRTSKRSDHFGLLGRELVEVIACDKRDLFEASLPEALFTLYYELLEEGVKEGIAKPLIKELKEGYPTDCFRDERTARLLLAHLMMRRMPPVLPMKRGRRIIALVGPTGVGKTTTAVKLAVAEMASGREAVIISSDAERVGAPEQIALFGKATGVPVEVAVNRRDLLQALSKHQGKGLIIIDTPGRNYHLNGWLTELQGLIPTDHPVEVHLVLSATTRDEELSRTVKRFLPLPLTALLFSKLDESATFGAIYNQTVRFRLPLSYFTTGQRVPEDIEKATKVRLVDLILKISREG